MEAPSINRSGAPHPEAARRVSTPAPEGRAVAEARAAAQAFEAAFLAEMLSHSGLNALPSGFGGGAGEEAFSSFLTREYGRLMAERGGVGLAEQVFEVMKQRMNP